MDIIDANELPSIYELGTSEGRITSRGAHTALAIEAPLTVGDLQRDLTTTLEVLVPFPANELRRQFFGLEDAASPPSFVDQVNRGFGELRSNPLAWMEYQQLAAEWERAADE